jgi:hypothetical protein
MTEKTKTTDPAFEKFEAHITPWFKKEFDEPLGQLLAETRRYYRGDPEFRAAVRRGDARAAKRELKELMGVVGC